MTQYDARGIESYTTYDGDRVFRYDVNGVASVAYIYGDQSPQFLAFDTPGEADRVFQLSRAAADKRQNVREVTSWTADARIAPRDDTRLTIDGWDTETHLADDDVTTWCGVPNPERSIIAPSAQDKPTCGDCAGHVTL